MGKERIWGDTITLKRKFQSGCQWIAIGIVIAIVAYLLASYLQASLIPIDGIEYISRKYDVPQRRVLELAALLEVAPQEILSPYDPHDRELYTPFPVVYFEQKIEGFRQIYGRPPTKAEVEKMVNGYIAKCEPTPSIVEYIYYSTVVHPEWFTEGPGLAMSVYFENELPAGTDPQMAPYGRISYLDLADDSMNPPNNPYYDNCVAKYLAEQGGGTPTTQP